MQSEVKNARFWKLKRRGNGGYGEAQAVPAPLLTAGIEKKGGEREFSEAYEIKMKIRN